MTESPAGGTDNTSPHETTIDLDAARKARREAKGNHVLAIRFLGEDYALPPELPAEAVHAFGALIAGDFAGLGAGVEALFGEAWPTIVAKARAAGDPLSIDDEVFLLEEALKAYGMDLPESSASGRS